MAKTICFMCKKNKECSYEPSRSQLYFGGWPVKMEWRCSACERKLVKKIDKMLRDIGETYKEWT